MTDLPPALRPWRSTLAALPPHVPMVLGPWLARLARPIGPLRRSRSTDDGPPDGFTGLSRRGPYERLVMTEWLLADTLPEEFIRRAAAKEHLFLQLARQEPAGGLRSVILFDAGPSQLGAPRLVHLAALVVFAQRAKDAGADLRFGVLQTAPEPLAEFNTATAERLMQSRSSRPPTAADWQSWLTAVSEGPTPIDDLWVVGGPDVAAWAAEAGAGHLQPEDLLYAHERAVEVRVQKGTTTQSLTLHLPYVGDCIRIFRAPYKARTQDPPPVANVRALGMRFSWDARNLLMRTADGICALRVPRHSGETGTLPRHLMIEDDEILAADNFKRDFVVLVASGTNLLLRYFNRRGKPSYHRDIADNLHFVRPGADHQMGPLIPLRLRYAMSPRLLTFDALNSAYIIRDNALTGLLSHGLQATRTNGTTCVLATAPKESSTVNMHPISSSGDVQSSRHLRVFSPAQAYFGATPAHRPPLVAYRVGFDQWTFVDRGDVVTADASRVVGATLHPFAKIGRMPSLVMVSDDRRSLQIVGPGPLAQTVRVPFEITEAIVASAHPLLAVRSEFGAVRVIRLDDLAVVAEVQP